MTRASANPPEAVATGAGARTAPAPVAQPCPLCASRAPWFHADARRPYYRCPHCHLIHVPAAWHVDPATEKAQYDLHDNRPDDPRYRRFLGRAADALRQRLPAPARGLDFGSGPGPTLSLMLQEAGYDVALYDPWYAPRDDALATRYDFITATEVFEHLRAPAAAIDRVLQCLHPGGWLIVMTKRAHGDRHSFARWHYTTDPTHVAFFATATFTWLADRYSLGLEIAGDDVVALQRPHHAAAGTPLDPC